ncbi:MAG: hypothetical protein ACKOGE_01095 [Actinomycetota bacterium]
MIRKALICAGAAALVAMPAVAMAGDVGSVGTPPAQISPLKILTPTVALTTGGSVLKVTVKVNTTGTQGFMKPALVTVCAGVSGCKALTLKVNTGKVPTGTFNLPLQGTLQAPFKVSLMITAASEGYRSVLKNVSLVCPS